jgi:ABC-2 type transport system permease protein
VVAVAHFFPLYHLVHAFTACFSPYTSGSGFDVRDLAAIAAWGAVGLAVAVRRFRWESEPREGRRRPFRAAPVRS